MATIKKTFWYSARDSEKRYSSGWCFGETPELASETPVSNYLNENGLVDGKIPSGKACPFIDTCTWKNERCPSATQTKPNDYSCAAARLHSIAKKK